jgi:hypothetical protein
VCTVDIVQEVTDFYLREIITSFVDVCCIPELLVEKEVVCENHGGQLYCTKERLNVVFIKFNHLQETTRKRREQVLENPGKPQ